MDPDRKQDEFMDFFVAEQSLIYGFVRSLVPNYTDAEELFQQVALTLWRKRDSYDPDRGAFRAWAVGIARNHIRNFDRKKLRERRVQVFAPDVIDRIAGCWQEKSNVWEERQAALEDCIAKLNSEDRQRLENHYAGGTRASELARDEGIALRTFYRKIEKIRKLLLDCIAKSVEFDQGTQERI